MSMHLVGPYLSTTSLKKRVDTLTKAKKEELEQGWRDRNVRLREMGLPKETLEQYTEWVYGRGKKKTAEEVNKSTSQATSPRVRKDASKLFCAPRADMEKRSNPSHPSLSSWVTGPCSSKQTPAYTGTKIIGIAQMAKSNAVPVFSEESIIDIAHMRR